MEEILNKIATADIEDMQDIMDAVAKRIRHDFPEWEVMYMALHKDPELRRQEVESIMNFMHAHNQTF